VNPAAVTRHPGYKSNFRAAGVAAR